MEINKLIRQVMEGSKPSELEGILYYQNQIVEVAKLVAAKERQEVMQEAREYLLKLHDDWLGEA
jgi:ribosomal protein L32E